MWNIQHHIRVNTHCLLTKICLHCIFVIYFKPPVNWFGSTCTYETLIIMVDWYRLYLCPDYFLWSLTENILVATLYHFLFPSDTNYDNFLDESVPIICYHIIKSGWPFVIEPLHSKFSMFGVISVTYIQLQLSYCHLLSIRNFTCIELNLLYVFWEWTLWCFFW